MPLTLARRTAIRTAIFAVPSAAVAIGGSTRASAGSVSSGNTTPSVPVVHYRTENVDGVDVFYREAGPPGGPVIVLLHGFPTSSHMFRNLIPLLATRYRVIAPDYPGFGASEMPERSKFAYTFARYADIVDNLLQQLKVSRYALYLMDYGAPVGFRIALKHPEQVTALVIQNGNAYAEGLKEFWNPFKAYWNYNSAANRKALEVLLTLPTTKFQYTDGVEDLTRIDPDNWLHDQTLLDRPGNKDIQLDLFYDYGTNLALYPSFQTFLRTRKPPTIIVWGANDKIFPADGALAYRKDLPGVEMHLLDTGHFALEDKLDVMAPLIKRFLDRNT
jgi:pimeloyl-ACP methyl ester carboxylesterase